VVGDELEVVAVEGIGNDQYGAARSREIVVRQIVGVFIRVVDETQFLEDSARIEAWCPHRLEAKRALSGDPLDNVIGLQDVFLLRGVVFEVGVAVPAVAVRRRFMYFVADRD
jgi:hypothetical protein